MRDQYARSAADCFAPGPIGPAFHGVVSSADVDAMPCSEKPCSNALKATSGSPSASVPPCCSPPEPCPPPSPEPPPEITFCTESPHEFFAAPFGDGAVTKGAPSPGFDPEPGPAFPFDVFVYESARRRLPSCQSPSSSSISHSIAMSLHMEHRPGRSPLMFSIGSPHSLHTPLPAACRCRRRSSSLNAIALSSMIWPGFPPCSRPLLMLSTNRCIDSEDRSDQSWPDHAGAAGRT